MVSNAPPDDPPPSVTRSPARPLTAWLSAVVPRAPAGLDDPTGATGWNPTMGFPECVTEESRAPPLLVRSWWTAPRSSIAIASAWVMLDSTELDLWGG